MATLRILVSIILGAATIGGQTPSSGRWAAIESRGRLLAQAIQLEAACENLLHRLEPSSPHPFPPLLDLGATRWTAAYLRVDPLTGTPTVVRILTCPPDRLQDLAVAASTHPVPLDTAVAHLHVRAQRQWGGAAGETHVITLPEPGGGASLYRMPRKDADGTVVIGEDFRLTFRPGASLPYHLTRFHRARWPLSAQAMKVPVGAKEVHPIHSHLESADPCETDVAGALLNAAMPVSVIGKGRLYTCGTDGTIREADLPKGAPQEGLGGPAPGQDLGSLQAFDFFQSVFDLENQWVVLPPRQQGSYMIACVYLDQEAGFTAELALAFTLNAQGFAQVDPQWPKERASFKVRLQGDLPASPLPPGLIRDLGLAPQPAFLTNYLPKEQTPQTLLKRGFHLNHLGLCDRALGILAPLHARHPDLQGLAFELAFAYNALNRASEALPVLQAATKRSPRDPWIARELAYTFLHLGQANEAIAAYETSLTLVAPDNAQERSEQAMNLAQAHALKGDLAKRDAWLEKARAWAPPGSPVAEHFAREDAAKAKLP
jgi:hypothetical protein